MSYQLKPGKSEDMDGSSNTPPEAKSATPSVTIHLCIPDDQERHLPKRRRAPHYLPPHVPLPRQGEVIYLSSSSAWGVTMVIHEWRAPDDLHIELWLEHVGSARHARPDGFVLTQ